jgi:hypothetical protein
MSNVPADLTWRIALEGTAVLVPLKTDETCCGQITMVSAQLLGIPVITSFSAATREYTQNCVTFSAGDYEGLADRVRAVHQHWEESRTRAANAVPDARMRYHRKHWAKAVQSFIESQESSTKGPPREYPK